MTTALPQEFRIGELAQAAGVHVETVRYYQRRGLLARPPRPGRGWRVYDEAVLRRLRFIRRAQAMGFTLDEVEQLLRFRDGGGSHACAQVQAATRMKIDELGVQISELQAKQAGLERLVAACASEPADCRILAAFDGQ